MTQPKYDPKLPDSEVLRKTNPGVRDKTSPTGTPEAMPDIDHEDAALSTAGEEMRPKDDTLGNETAR